MSNIFWLDIEVGDTFIVSDNKDNFAVADIVGKQYKVTNVIRDKYKTKVFATFDSGDIECWEDYNTNVYYNDQLVK